MNYSLLSLVFFVVLPYTYGTISDWRLCADPECRGALSSGVATLTYQSIEPMVLSFSAGDEVTIFSKEAGQNKELWGAEVRGRRGYIPKRLVREMRIFVRSPTHTVPTELIQPTVMQQPIGQTAFNSQQPQVQHNGPKGNFAPNQQPQQPQHLNPQHQNNNILPNQPVGMQPPQLPQHQKPLMQPPTQAPTTTTTTSPAIPTTEAGENNDANQDNVIKAVPLKAQLSSSTGEPPVPLEQIPAVKEPKSSGDSSEKQNQELEEADDDGFVSGGDEDENDSKEDDTDEEEDDVLDKEESIIDAKLASNSAANLADVASSVSQSDGNLQSQQPALDSVVDMADLPGVDSSSIHSLHVRSIDDAIENTISIANEPSNTSSTLEKSNPSMTSASSVSESETNTLPKEQLDVFSSSSNDEEKVESIEDKQVDVPSAPLKDEKQVENAEDIEKIDSLKNEPVITPLEDLPAADTQSKELESGPQTPPGGDVTTGNELKEAVVDSLIDGSVQSNDELVFLATETGQTNESTSDIDKLDSVDNESLVPESIPFENSHSDEKDVLTLDSEPGSHQLETPEGKTEADQQLPSNETPFIGELSSEPFRSEEMAQEPVVEAAHKESVIDAIEPPPPVVEKKAEQVDQPSSSEGSGGGFLDSALNWLGLSDMEEPLQMEKGDENPLTDPTPLQEQIASMNPTTQNENDSAQPPSAPNGFCDTQECAQLGEPPAEKPILHDHSHIGGHDDHGHGDHGHHEHHHDHGPAGHGHHHHHDHDGHDHDHHHHDHGSFGHGHSHIPGYIPGFRHHYKPPAAAAVVTPPESATPPVEPPSVLPNVEPVVEAKPPISVENVDPLPIASQPVVTEQQPPLVGGEPSGPPIAEPLPTYATDPVPDYIPVEEIFNRAQSERDRLLQEQQQTDAMTESWIDSISNMLTLSDVTSSSNLFLILSTSAAATALFLALYYVGQNKTTVAMLKARISQLDTQLHETQTVSDESSNIQTKLTEYETDTAQLRSLKEQAEAEKSVLTRRIAELERERDALERDVEAATETATEANRMFEELLASQSENDEWQRSVEALQQQLNKQQMTMENLNTSLCVKTAENETLSSEVDELRAETERYKVRVKSLQSDLETLKTSNRNFQQKMALESGELMKLKQEKEGWVSERRSLTGQINRHAKEVDEWRDKTEQLKKSLKAKESDLARSLQLLKESGNDSQSVVQLTSLVQLESELAEANQTVDRLKEELKTHLQLCKQHEDDKAALELVVANLKSSSEAAAKEKREAETRLEVLSNYFKEKETQLQKELGTHEAKRAITEESVSESVRKRLEMEENLILYKSQVETLTKEIEEQKRSYKSLMSTHEQRAHENYMAARQLERRLEESKQEAAQLRQRLTQVEKEKEALLVVAKENGTTNGSADADLIQPVIKRQGLGLGIGNNDELGRMEHPPFRSPPPPPPPGGPIPPPPGPPFASLPFIPPAPFMPHNAGMFPNMHLLPSAIPPPPPPDPLVGHHRPNPLGMLATGSYDYDYRHDLSGPVPPRHNPSPFGSERSVRSDRSDRMDHYDNHFRPVSPYGRHGGRPRSVGRSRDVSPERPRSYSPLPSPLGPPHTTEDWDDGRNYNRPPMMRSGSLRQPPSGPKTSSPLIQPTDNGDRHRPPPH